MNGEHNQPIGLAEKVEQARQDKEITAIANAVPMPGPLRDAFSPQQDIVVGRYKIRPFYDIDFEILQQVGHPLAKMALGGAQYGDKIQDLRGENAWLVCWLLAHDVDEVDEVAQKGAEAVKKAARKEFGRLQLGGILELCKAVLEQFARYFSTVVGLEQAASEDEEAKPLPKT